MKTRQAAPDIGTVIVRLAVPGPALSAAALPLLSEADRDRAARFLVAGARDEFLAGRWLLRTTLAELLGAPATSFRWVTNAHGAPSLAEPWTRCRFNLSHTRGLAALAVTWDRDIGVDVEYRHRKSRTVAIAHRFFAPAEVAALGALPDAASQRDRFFDYWTLKESYIKARQMGLAIPLKAFAFSLGPPIRVALDASLHDTAHNWVFRRFDPTASHRLALAIRTEGAPWTLRLAWAAP